MRFIFKTSYDQDIRLVKHGGQSFWYGLLVVALVAAPAVVSEYYLSQLTFICIYGMVGVGLMLLTGYTGQVSLGHAAFLAVGAYTEAVLQAHGVPFGLSLAAAGLLAGLAGIVIGLPALRLTGIYLVIATMAFGFIVQEVLTRWESVTRGNLGMTLRSIDLFGVKLNEEWKLYYLALALLVLVLLGVLNLLRAPTGRAFVAIRDSEISAQSMGIHLARYKTVSFALSAAHHRARRRAVRAQAPVHQPRAVRAHPLDRARDDDLHRRHRLAARRDLRRDLPHRAAAADRGREGLPAGRRSATRPASSRRCSA